MQYSSVDAQENILTKIPKTKGDGQKCKIQQNGEG